MSTSSLVSVIIPAYNAEDFITQTLESVLAQTYSAFEIIVVDDGSRDRTAEIVQTMQAQDSRIRLIQQQNGGIAAARNCAIAHARGTYIAPVDADDLWLPTKLEKQVRCIEAAGPKVGLVYARSVDIDESGHIMGQYSAEQMNCPEGNVLIPLIFHNFLHNGSTMLFRSSCIEQLGAYNKDMRLTNSEGCEDWDLCLRIAEHYEFRCVPEFLIAYRRYSGSVSSNSARMARSYEIVMAGARQRNPGVPEHIYRWSASIFYNYLAGKSCVSGDYSTMLRFFFRGVTADASLLLQPGVYKAIPLAMLKLLLQPITTLIWQDHQAWTAFKHRLKPPSSSGIPIQELARTINPERIQQKMYARVLRSRLDRVVQWARP